GEREDGRDAAQRAAHVLLRRRRRAHVDGGARPADQRGARARGRGDRRGHARGGLPVLHRHARRRRAQRGREDAGDRPRDAAARGGRAQKGRRGAGVTVERARAVVIGGGITGASVAYHLAKAGWRDTLLLEKGELTSGSTCHAAGLVTQFNPSPTMMRFRRYSIELYRELGVFETVGGLRFASSRQQLMELQRGVSRARGIGLQVELVAAEEAARLMPVITTESLYGAVWVPGDGALDPHSATHALAKAARSLGARVQTDTRVTGIVLSSRGAIQAVVTPAG